MPGPVDVRETALTAIVDPHDLTLTDDPLVRLLAGRVPGVDAESASAVLTGFEGLLPCVSRRGEERRTRWATARHRPEALRHLELASCGGF